MADFIAGCDFGFDFCYFIELMTKKNNQFDSILSIYCVQRLWLMVRMKSESCFQFWV